MQPLRQAGREAGRLIRQGAREFVEGPARYVRHVGRVVRRGMGQGRVADDVAQVAAPPPADPYEIHETIVLQDVETNSRHGDAQSLQYKFDVGTEIHVVYYNEGNWVEPLYREQDIAIRQERVISGVMRGILSLSNQFVEKFKQLRQNPNTSFEEYESLITLIDQKKDITGKAIDTILWEFNNENGVTVANARIETDKLDIFFDQDRVTALEFLSRFQHYRRNQQNNANQPPQANNNLAGGRRRKTGKRRQKKRLTRRR